MTALRLAIVGLGKIARDKHIPAISAIDGVTLAGNKSRLIASKVQRHCRYLFRRPQTAHGLSCYERLQVRSVVASGLEPLVQ